MPKNTSSGRGKDGSTADGGAVGAYESKEDVQEDDVVLEEGEEEEAKKNANPPKARVSNKAGPIFDGKSLQADYVIIGAGISGLACAWEILRLRGLKPNAVKAATGKKSRRGSLTDISTIKTRPSVIIVEANDRIGGRLCSVTTESGPAVDVGGMWVGAKHDAVKHFLNAELKMGDRLVPQRAAGAKIVDLEGNKFSYTGLVPWEAPSIAGLMSTLYGLIWLRCYRARASRWHPWQIHRSIKDAVRVNMVDFLVMRMGLPCTGKEARQKSTLFWKSILNCAARTMFGADLKHIGASYFLSYCRGSDHVESMADMGPGTLQEQYLQNGAGEMCARMASQLRKHGVVFKTHTKATGIQQDPDTKRVTVTVAPSYAVPDEPISRYYRPDSRDAEQGCNEHLEETYVVRTGTNNLAKDNSFVEIETSNVILAVPPPCYKSIRFTPDLPPEKKEILECAKMGKITKTIVCFNKVKAADGPFWVRDGFSGEANGDGVAFLNEKQVRKILHEVPDGPVKENLVTAALYASQEIGCVPINSCMDVSQPDEQDNSMLIPCLGCFAGGTIASLWKDASMEMRRDAIIFQLVRWFGPGAAFPKEIVDCDWSKHKTIGGGPVAYFEKYANADGKTSEGLSVLSKPFDMVHFAGTEMAGSSQGFMDGAIRAGIRAAQEVSPEDNLKRLPPTYKFSYRVGSDTFIIWPLVCAIILGLLIVVAIVLPIALTV